MNSFVAITLKERYNIHLKFASGQGSNIVSVLRTELEAGKDASDLDLVWINGETFYQLRQINALFGPFTHVLPNSSFIDLSNPFIGIDFQQKVEGYECPWGNVQLVLIYDTVRVANPPASRQELEEFVMQFPGRFTIPVNFTGLTLLKSFMISMAGQNELYGPFDEEKYKKYSGLLWEYINRIKPYFWRRGETFPYDIALMHRMFADGELFLSMSNNDAEAENKVLQGLFPASTKAYVLKSGTIQNSHYLGIPRHSQNKEAAMVVCNFLVSPEAQYEKLQPSVWGDGSILDIKLLEGEWKEAFRKAMIRERSPLKDTLQRSALQELAPEYMIRLNRDFRKYVVGE